MQLSPVVEKLTARLGTLPLEERELLSLVTRQLKNVSTGELLNGSPAPTFVTPLWALDESEDPCAIPDGPNPAKPGPETHLTESDDPFVQPEGTESD